EQIVTGVASLVAARFGGRATFTITNQTEEEIKTLVESGEESGEIEMEERNLLHSVFEFTDTVAREVMTPRVDLDAMPVTSAPAAVAEVIKESGHSRIPLYEETDDQIVGIVHAKDLYMALLNGHEPNLRELMRQPLFVPENKDLHELLSEMRAARSQMAVVQDEFGGTAGLVTIEEIGSAYALEQELTFEVKGRDNVTGLPRQLHLTSQEVREAMADNINQIIEAVKGSLERIPPELSSDLVDRGIVLAGGGSLIRKIDRAISEATGLPVFVAEDPLCAVVNGTGKILANSSRWSGRD
ncbi:MAG: rod shape-determining protein, partial [Verrucomicrobiota bacterium]